MRQARIHVFGYLRGWYLVLPTLACNVAGVLKLPLMDLLSAEVLNEVD